MNINFSRLSKKEMLDFIDKFNKDVKKKKDLSKQLKELQKQPRKNKVEIEQITKKIERLSDKISKNRNTMKEYLEKTQPTSKVDKNNFMIVEYISTNYLDKIAVAIQEDFGVKTKLIPDIRNKNSIFIGSYNQCIRFAKSKDHYPLYAIDKKYFDKLKSLNNNGNNNEIELFLDKNGKQLPRY